MRRNAQSGFSLIELMVAMVITLIITGAMFGLLVGGQSAFTTQPERTDRQQNMRAAMDVVMRDVASAGVGMPNFVQTLTPNLDGDANAALGSEVGPSGAKWDELEILTNTSGFSPEYACHYPGGKSAVVRLQSGLSNVVTGPVMVFFYDGTYAINYVTDADGTNKTGASGGQVVCDSGQSHVQLNFNSGAGDPSGMNDSKGICQPNALGLGNAGTGTAGCDGTGPATGECCEVNYVVNGTLVHYWIEKDAQGIPNLWRVENGSRTSGTGQLLARGIEDLQVQYVRSDGAISNVAPAVAPNDFTSLITQVRVQLFARAINARIQGAVTTTDTAITHQQGVALRGAMSAQASPRQALWVLTQEDPPPATPRWN